MTNKDKSKEQLINTVMELRRRVEELESREKRRNQAEKILAYSHEQLCQAQRMEALGTLVAGVAHEINNPLNLIMFNIPLLQKVWHDFLPVLRERSKTEPKLKYGGLSCDFLQENLDRLLADMDMACNRVANTVANLKNFARQSNVSDKKPLQLNSAVVNAVRLLQTMLRKSGFHLDLDLGRDLPEMLGNLQNIEQIILNITINAFQAIDHAHGEIKIKTGLQRNSGLIYLSISDNGRGVDPSIADKLFDPFVTDKQTQGGTGLGLSVTYNMVKAHDGQITFESQPGKGTVFRVFFPSIAQQKAARVLIVDDDPGIRDLLAQALRHDRPYLLDEASNGIEACIRLGSHTPDLLILDIFMPEMNGLEVCRTIKKEPELSDMYVIITTGLPDNPMLEEVAALGFTNIYYKPFKLQELVKAVDDILLARKSRLACRELTAA